jgi:hypothetical protein
MVTSVCNQLTGNFLTIWYPVGNVVNFTFCWTGRSICDGIIETVVVIVEAVAVIVDSYILRWLVAVAV